MSTPDILKIAALLPLSMGCVGFGLLPGIGAAMTLTLLGIHVANASPLRKRTPAGEILAALALGAFLGAGCFLLALWALS